MARIRSIKPEFWDDEAIGLLSRDARLLFVATWNMADDEGLLRWSASYVKANAFMYDDDLTVERVTALMTELVGAGLIRSYTGGKARQSLAWVVQFGKHQKPNRPQPSKLPPPSIQNGDVLAAYVRRDHNICHLCGEECSTEHDQPRLWPSLDHVTPRSAGGSDYPSNLRLSHRTCNHARGDRPTEQFTDEAPSQHAPRSVPNSVNEAVNESLSLAVPEGRGGVREREKELEGVPATPGALAPRDDAQALVGEWIERCAERPPRQVIGHLSKQIKELLDEGIDPSHVRRGLVTWQSKGLHPSALPSVVNESMNARPLAMVKPSTTDALVHQTLALAEHMRAQERGA